VKRIARVQVQSILGVSFTGNRSDQAGHPSVCNSARMHALFVARLVVVVNLSLTVRDLSNSSTLVERGQQLTKRSCFSSIIVSQVTALGARERESQNGHKELEVQLDIKLWPNHRQPASSLLFYGRQTRQLLTNKTRPPILNTRDHDACIARQNALPAHWNWQREVAPLTAAVHRLAAVWMLNASLETAKMPHYALLSSMI